MANTKLTISAKDGNILTIDDLPDYAGFDKPGWVAMLCDAAKTTTPGDPTVTGDYQYYVFVTVDRVAKTIHEESGLNLSSWTVGCTLVLYNPFLNYDFLEGQDTGPIINKTGAPAWRSSYSINGGMFRHSDGRFIWLFSGWNGSYYQIGYIHSTNMIDWIYGNTDAPVVTPGDVDDCYGVHQAGSVYKGGKLGLYCLVACVRESDHGMNVTRIMYFNEDLTEFEFSDSLLSEEPMHGCIGSSIVKIGKYFHIPFIYVYAAQQDREIRIAKSLNLEGPYLDYQTIVVGTGSNDGVAWSFSADNVVIFKTGQKIFGLFGGTSQWSQSGNKGNRFYCLMTYDKVTELWTPDKRGIVIMNPAYFYNINGEYQWAVDHCGGYPAMLVDGKDVYMSITMRGTVYQPAMLKLRNARV